MHHPPVSHNLATWWAMTLLWDVCPTSPLTNPVAKTINHCPSDIQMHCSACLLRRCNHTHFDNEDPSGYGLPSGALPDRPRDQSNNRHSARNHSDTWPNVSAYPKELYHETYRRAHPFSQHSRSTYSSSALAYFRAQLIVRDCWICEHRRSCEAYSSQRQYSMYIHDDDQEKQNRFLTEIISWASGLTWTWNETTRTL